jgi:AAA+ superfamily predicted ATPase
MTLVEEIKLLIKSRYPVIYLETIDEEYITNQVKTMADEMEFDTYYWSISNGLRYGDQEDSFYNTNAPAYMLKNMLFIMNDKNYKYNGLMVFYDLHKHLEDPSVLRLFKDLIQRVKGTKDTIVLISSQYVCPTEIQNFTAHIVAGYPSESEIRQLIKESILEIKRVNKSFKLKITKPELKKIVTILKGLSLNQIMNFLNQVTAGGTLETADIATLIDLKKQTFDKAGYLEFCPQENISNVAGFENLKSWLRVRKKIFTNTSKKLPPPKGIMLMGVQGCGKSTAIKAIANELDIPLYRFDMSRLYSSYLGETEENLRKTINIIEKLSPLCLWVDEIEKGFTTSDGKVDGGVSQRILGTFLTWMQERKSKCFIAATANQIKQLPPEFLRKGRFDELFFVDLPTIEERETLIKIHIKKREYNPEEFDIKELAKNSVDFSGAEIEQGIISAIYGAVSEDEPLCSERILQEFQATKPLAVLKSNEIMQLRLWAKDRTLPV